MIYKNIYHQMRDNNLKIIGLMALFPMCFLVFVACFFALYAAINQEVALSQIMESFYSIVPLLIGVCMILTLISVAYGDKMMLYFADAILCPKDKHYASVFKAVENMALAAGLPTPKVYLIHDDSLNAFATGFCPKTSAVVLTTGLVEKLTSLELQAVVAHEIAHIKNRDVRLNMYIITGIGMIGLLGDVLVRWQLMGRRKTGFTHFLALLGLVMILFRFFVAPFIHMAISRQQEFQADAVGAYLTRHPLALASALKKIAYNPRINILEESKQMAVACICSPLVDADLLDTHPPVSERIKRLQEMA